MKKIIIACIFLQSFCLLHSQTLLPHKVEEPKNEIFLTIALEPVLTTEIGFQHAISKKDFQWHMGGSLKIAPLILSQKAFRTTLFSNYNFSNNRNGLILQPAIYIANLSDRAGDKTSVGMEFQALPYWVGRKWTKGIMVGWQHAFLTYMRHSEAAKETFSDRYENSTLQKPGNGWYSSTANRVRIGFVTGHLINKQFSLQLNLGSQFILQKQKVVLGFAYGQVPIFLEGKIRYRFF